MSEVTHIKLMPIQQALMTLLSDGLVHNKKQLKAAADDPQMEDGTLYQNIAILRRELRIHSNLDVMNCNGEGYRLVRLISDH